MRLHSKGGKMFITHKARIAGYKPHIWFDKKCINNLISLNNLINQYRVTYESLDEMFIFYR